MTEIKKVIIPIAGAATRFLPLSKVLPKDILPIADIPSIQYLIKEAKDSGIEEIIFVLSPNNKKVLDYVKNSPKLEKTLKEKNKGDILEEMKDLDELFSGLKFSSVIQKEPLGDGHAILQAAKLIKDEPVAVMFGDDIISSKVPSLEQLAQVFKTCKKPIIGLFKLPREKLVSYGVPILEKIASKLFKIKGIIEKPDLDSVPSDYAITGRYILTPEVFDYLKKAKPTVKGEIILAEVINNHMIKEGRLIYGYEIDGKWFECGDKLKWLKSNLYFSLNHPKYGAELREYLKEIL